MGQFKPMVKMETTEPSVILKLKKGGHVSQEHKDEDGHTNMKGKAFMSARAEEAEEGCSPSKPSMSERRKAMSGALLKKGGKVDKKAMGGPMGVAPAPVDPRKAALLRAMMAKRGAPMAAPAAPMAAPGGLPTMKKGGKAEKREEREIQSVKKELKHHEHEKAGKAHHGLKAGGTVEGNEGAFTRTKVVDGDKADKANGTKGVRTGNAGGYKAGGTIEGNEGAFKRTKVVDGDHEDKARGTKGIKETNGGGYAKGGGVEGNVSSTPPGVTNRTTGGVKEANAGGYKKGGHAKKHFATGGSVNNTGRAVAMPNHFVSKPISNTAQSGTFKKGGRVKKYADGDRVEDASKGAYDKASQPEGMSIATSIRNAPSNAVNAMKRLLGMGDKPAK